jgi:AcrR family transcriptional regulator
MAETITKGEATKRKIIEAAKREFYKHGYNKATMKDITDQLEFKPSLITYHFKTKDNLVTAIYEDLFAKIKKRVEESNCNIPNKLLFHYVCTRLLYRLLFFDESTIRFFYEINENAINYTVNNHLITRFYHEIINEFNLLATDQILYIMLKYSTTNHRDFFVDFIKGEYPGMTIDDALNIFERIIPITLHLDANFVDSMLLASISIANSIDTSDIKFLI